MKIKCIQELFTDFSWMFGLRCSFQSCEKKAIIFGTTFKFECYTYMNLLAKTLMKPFGLPGIVSIAYSVNK